MYEESGSFDPNAMIAQGTEDCFPQIVIPPTATTQTQKTPYSNEDAAMAATPMEITTHDPHYNHVSSEDLSFHHQHHFPYPTPTPDLLNFLHLPPPSPFEIPKPSMGIGGGGGGDTSTNVSSLSYDPFLHLNLQAPHQGALRDLQAPQSYTMPPSRVNDFVFGIDGSGVAYNDGDERNFGNGVLEFAEGVSFVGKRRGGKRAKQFTSTTERQRRVDLSGKFDALKELIPNLSKSDRASVVGDAIEHIKELLRTRNELKLLAKKKRHEKERTMIKRQKVETGGDGAVGELDDNSYIESLRSSWIQRKSKDTEVDVRIVDNEVTIKLVQRKKNNCLMHAARALDELKLDLHHVAGGHIGDFCSFLFNSKICEGSSVYASAIANKLIETMDASLNTA